MLSPLIKSFERSYSIGLTKPCTIHYQLQTSQITIDAKQNEEREREISKVGEIPRGKEEVAAITMITEIDRRSWNLSRREMSKVADRWDPSCSPYSSPSSLITFLSLCLCLLSHLYLICHRLQKLSAFRYSYFIHFCFCFLLLLFFVVILNFFRYLFGSDYGKVVVVGISYGFTEI